MKSRLTLRALLALSELAVHCDDIDVRTDLTDEMAELAELLSAGGEKIAELRAWSSRVGALLWRLPDLFGTGQVALTRARMRLLRMAAALGRPPAPRKVPEPVVAPRIQPPVQPAAKLTKSQEQVLEVLRSDPGLRPRELIGRFIGALSDRTVKRILKELTALDLIKRTEHSDGIVSYDAIAKND